MWWKYDCEQSAIVLLFIIITVAISHRVQGRRNNGGNRGNRPQTKNWYVSAVSRELYVEYRKNRIIVDILYKQYGQIVYDKNELFDK